MRRVIYFLFLGTTFYLAGTYKLVELLILFLASIILFVFLFITNRYCIKKISANIEIKNTKVNRDNIIKGKVIIKNEGFLPITYFSIKIEYLNSKISKTAIENIKGYVTAKSKVEMDFEMKSKHCGVIYINIKEIKVYDYLSLFNSKKKGQSNIKVLVLPSGHHMRIERESNNYIKNPLKEGGDLESLMNKPPEILWIDKYKQGDSIRNIHWKLSARNDEILTKKFASDEEDRILFFIDLRKVRDINIELMDTFYELCAAISLGLIENKISHLVRWYDIEKMCVVDRLVRTEGEYRSMMEEIILKAKVYEKKFDDEVFQNIYLHENNLQTVICLNLDLKLFLHKDLIMQFTEENYIQEIERRCFTV